MPANAQNLATDIEYRSQEATDQTGLIFEDGTEYTYGEIEEIASKFGAFLKDLGVDKGDRVMFYMQNSPELIFSYYGCWKIGAVPVTINVMYKTEEVMHAIEETNPKLVISDYRNLSVINDIHDLVKNVIIIGGDDQLDNLEFTDYYNYHSVVEETPNTHLEPVVVNEEDEGLIQFTGGTTGHPKAVSVTHHGKNASLKAFAKKLKNGKEGPYSTSSPETPPNIDPFPLFHSAGITQLLLTYRVGRATLLMERFRTEKFLNLTEKYQPDHLFLFPTMIHDLTNYSDENEASLSSVNYVLSGGQEVPLSLQKRFENKYKIPILQIYGATETGNIAMWSPKDIKSGEWKPGSAGKIIEGIKIKIVDDEGNTLDSNETGEIIVNTEDKRDYVASDELKTEDGWVHTGDVGYLDDDGALYVVDRKRNMIKCGGFQVWPAELEETLLDHPDVKNVAVVGKPDERMGEIPKAYIVPTTELPDKSEKEQLKEDIIQYCRDELAHYKYVREIEFKNELPVTDSGKIKRSKLEN